MRKSSKKLGCDVLVIGSGIAGMTAALAAIEQGADVIILSKGRLGKGCSTVMSGGRFMMESEGFSIKDHCRLTIEVGCQINDRKLVHKLCQEAPDRRKWLESKLEADFQPVEKGYRACGGGPRLAANFVEALQKSDIFTIERVIVTNLLVQDERCFGCSGIANDGNIITVKSNATIVATGGFSGIYSRNDNPSGNVGDGIALGLKAGADVRDLEFVQFYPMGIAEKGLPNVMLFRPFPAGTKLVNEEGESILDKYLGGIELNEAVGSKRDILSGVIALESEHDKPIYLDLTRVNWKEQDKWRVLKFLSRYSFDFESKPIRVAPIAHYSMGGLQIDENAETSISGLYAAGEVTGGIHGANRHGGNSLTDCLVFGFTAGAEAARRSDRINSPTLNNYSELSQFAMMGEFTPNKVKQQLGKLTWANLGIIRDAESLKRGKRALSELKREIEFLKIKTVKDLRAAIELENGLLIAEMISEFAQRRTESRGAHYRRDYPNEDRESARSQFVRLRGKSKFLSWFGK